MLDLLLFAALTTTTNAYPERYVCLDPDGAIVAMDDHAWVLGNECSVISKARPGEEFQRIRKDIIITAGDPVPDPDPIPDPIPDPDPDPDPGPDPVPDPNAELSFVDVSTQLPGNCKSPNSFGMSLADINNDGLVDVVSWSHYRRDHCAWLNDGDGTYTAVSDFKAQTDPHFAFGWSVVHLDLDGDGDLDAQGRTSEGRDGYAENNAAGTVDFRTFVRTPWGDGDYPSYADIDQDGDLEVVSKVGVFDVQTEALLAGVGVPLGGGIAIDVDNDGDVDHIHFDTNTVRKNSGGIFSVSHAEGNLVHCRDNSASGGVANTIATILPFDFDLDGDIDLACFREADDNLRVLVNDGTGRFSVVDESTNGSDVFQGGLGVISKAAHVAEDLNNDGLQDILIGGRSRPNAYLLNQGDGTFHQLNDVQATGKTKGSCGYTGTPTVVVNDVDADGDLDLLQKPCSGTSNPSIEAQLFHNSNAGGGRHLQFVLTGAGSNTSAIGAKVEAFANGQRVAIKHLHGWSKAMQTYGLIHLGMGDHTSVDVRITWPDGTVQVHSDVLTNDRYQAVQGQLLQ